jgi:N-acetylglucosaminylphosphatidylinositol deacetylase
MGPRFQFRLNRNRTPLFRVLFFSLVIVPTTLYFLLAYIIPTSPALVPPSLIFAKRPVLITAHPDDESLFFGPTVLSLSKMGAKEFFILVLSTGM